MAGRAGGKPSMPTVGKTAPAVNRTVADGRVGDAFSLPTGPVDLAAIKPNATPVGPKRKKQAAKLMEKISVELAGLQEKLYAEAMGGGRRSILLVLQGMDTSGKDGVVEHVVGLVNPAGVHLVSFKKPTKEELQHDFLWRIEKQLPPSGRVGVFNRSHYEDVLVVKVHKLVPQRELTARYPKINDFEARLAAQGVVVVKCFLHISKEAQTERLLARLDDKTKFWKYNPGDVAERALWPAYQDAYALALQRCNTESAPWFIVPGDRKWYRNWAVAALLLEVLRAMDPQYPAADFDPAAEQKRVAAS